jgi:pyruvate/2-oxoglutarate/acetoin dehydrogenase E1 component
VPGLWVVAPHALLDPGALLRQAIDIDDPVLFIENKIGYGEQLGTELPDYAAARLADAASPFPTLWLAPRAAADGLLLCYGGMTHAALAAAATLREREDLHLAIGIVSQLAPTPATHVEAILSSGAPAAVVTVEEAPAEGGWGAELIATIEGIRDSRRLGEIAYRRVGAKSTPIPSARALEDAVLPQADDIVAAVLDCF